jgi:hypothetical protein
MARSRTPSGRPTSGASRRASTSFSVRVFGRANPVFGFERSSVGSDPKPKWAVAKR